MILKQQREMLAICEESIPRNQTFELVALPKKVLN